MKLSLAFVFPGQGSQSVGMLAALAQAEPVVAETFAEASASLGYDLWQRVQTGPEAALNQTACTQPAMLAAGVAVWRVWQAHNGAQPVLLAGHSLGEYTALVCAGVLNFADAVKLVEQRGQFMQAAVPAGQGAMAALLGLDDDQVRSVCAAASSTDEIVAAANFNAPGQVVIAGHANAVERAIAAARDAGAKRALPLPVSVPSHCSLMQPAATQLATRISQLALNKPLIPVLHNADVTTHDSAESIARALAEQLSQPVRWVETVQQFRAAGVTQVLECGPGKVLAGLVKRIDRDLDIFAVHDPDSLQAALAALPHA